MPHTDTLASFLTCRKPEMHPVPQYLLSTETELLDDSSVSLDVSLFEVIKETTSLTYELEKRTAGYIVFLVLLQMLSQVSDTVGK